MKTRWKVLLVLVAVICFAISLSYPVKYSMQKKDAEAGMERLTELRNAGLEKRGERRDERETVASTVEAGKEDVEESVLPAEGEQAEGATPSDLEGGTSETLERPENADEAAPVDETIESMGAAQLGESETAEDQTSIVDETDSLQSEAVDAAQPAPASQADASASEQAEIDAAQSQEEPSAPSAEQAQEQPVEPSTEQTQEQPVEPSAEQAQEQPVEPSAEQAQEQPVEPSVEQTQEQIESSPEAITAPMVTLLPIPTQTPEPTPTPTPAPTVNRFERSGAIPYDQKPKRTLEEDKILPQFQEIYAENKDFAGWITIPNTDIDYPVVQAEDSEYYLHHDFFGEENANGQIILDTKCDPYTPSYNLVVSGHNMRSGMMFGNLKSYVDESYWKDHKLVYFDTLMNERTYVVFAAFYSADYDVDETGFRYNADIQYSIDARRWLEEVKENELYDTGIDVEFGDEFLTLTTCNKAKRSDGRFVVVCRRLREGETIE